MVDFLKRWVLACTFLVLFNFLLVLLTFRSGTNHEECFADCVWQQLEATSMFMATDIGLCMARPSRQPACQPITRFTEAAELPPKQSSTVFLQVY